MVLLSRPGKRQLHVACAVVGKCRGCRVGIDAAAGGLTHPSDPVLGGFAGGERLGFRHIDLIDSFLAESPGLKAKICHGLGDVLGQIAGTAAVADIGVGADRAGPADSLDIQLLAELQNDLVADRELGIDGRPPYHLDDSARPQIGFRRRGRLSRTRSGIQADDGMEVRDASAL